MFAFGFVFAVVFAISGGFAVGFGFGVAVGVMVGFVVAVGFVVVVRDRGEECMRGIRQKYRINRSRSYSSLGYWYARSLSHARWFSSSCSYSDSWLISSRSYSRSGSRSW